MCIRDSPDAVLARAAAHLPDEPFGLLAVAPGGLCQVKVQPAAPRVDVRVARVLLLPPLIVGLDVVNAGALVFCKTQYRIPVSYTHLDVYKRQLQVS